MPGQHIFITNDDETYLDVIAEVLHAAGYAQVSTYVGSGPYQAIRKAMPDLVLLDVSMANPARSWTTLDILRMHPDMRPIPIVLGLLDQRILEGKEALFEQMQCFVLPKPYDQTTLLAAVTTILGPSRGEST